MKHPVCLCVFHLLVLHDLSVGLDASPPLGGAGVSGHQLLHHLPLLLLLDQVLGDAPPPVFPPGQVLNHRQMGSETRREDLAQAAAVGPEN